MTRKYYILFAAIALPLTMLSSCFVGKVYERPELKTDSLYRLDQVPDSTSSLTADSTSFAEISWREFFSDPLLRDYIDSAIHNNLDIRMAIKNIEAAEVVVRQGKAGFQPQANANLGYSRNKTSENMGQPAVPGFNQFNLGVDLSWEADIWGKIKSQLRADESAYLQTIEAQRAVQTRLISNVAITYYQLMMVDEQKEIAERSILSRDSSLLTTQALQKSGHGGVTALAVKQTEALVYESKLILVNLKKQERVLENALSVLLNQSPHTIRRNKIGNQEITTSLQLGVPSELLVNRPDVRQAEYGLMQAFELTNVARSNFYPSLTITGNAGLQSAKLSNWFNGNSFFGSIGAGLLQPILARRQIRTAYEVAETQQEQAALRYQQVLLDAGSEVSNALFDFHTQNETIALRKKQLEINQDAVNFSQQLLINGLANYLEVLTARQNVLNTELSLSDARFERLASIVDLYTALGGGWQ